MEWASDPPAGSLLVERRSGAQQNIARGHGDERIEAWIICVNFCEILIHDLHARDLAVLEELLQARRVGPQCVEHDGGKAGGMIR